MILLNVKSGKIIHAFKCFDGEQVKSEITALEPSPAIDTIAVGTSKGMVHLINIRCDQLLFSLRHKSKDGKPARITSMSFRTDGSALQYGIAPMAVGRADGTITIWDLTPAEDEEESPLGRTLLCEMEGVHYPGGVHKLQYMPQEPLLLSTGTHSNSILMHIFDSPDHSGRVLRERKGHTSYPKYIRYLHPGAGAGGGVLVNAADGTDASACQILSSGGADRTLRIFSTVRSVLDKEYSQGRGLERRARELGMSSKAELLLPPVAALITAETRSRDWGDLVTIHQDHAVEHSLVQF
jgi:U3 small nucleolar RNA-associated protein 21